MIVYFSNRAQEVIGQASTGLPSGLIIVDDKKTEDIDTGVASFELTISYKAAERLDVEKMTEAGNYVFRSSGNDAECYTIIDAETDTKARERHLYCEDAGLDLLNEICGSLEADRPRNIAWYINQFANDSGFEIGTNELADLTRTLKWDGEQTATERIRSIATQFNNAEISYRFVIEDMQITHRYIDIWEKRGVDINQELRLDRDIDNILVKRSVANLITSVFATGQTLEGEDAPLDLIGASYDDGDIYLDTRTGILYSRSGHGRWARPNEGYIQGRFNYDTESQTELLNRAVAYLRQFADVAVNYDVDIVRGLENTLIGDRVNIVDDLGEVYISGRILKLETSVTGNYKKATLGEYLIKTSGISDQILAMAADVQKAAAVADSVRILAETVDSMFQLEVASDMGFETATLTAHLYHANKEVTQDYSPAMFKWIKRTEYGEHMISRGYTLGINLEEVGYAGTILCRFIRPELYDLTDHNLTTITNEDGEPIQVSYAGLHSEPVVRRASKLMALNKASNTRDVMTGATTGYPVLAREVNLYEYEGFSKIIQPVVQHFWTDDEGAHITEVDKDTFLRDPADGGGNLLAKSTGVYVRDGEKWVAEFSSDGAKFYKNEEATALIDNVGATFYTEAGTNVQLNGTGLFFQGLDGKADIDGVLSATAVGAVLDEEEYDGAEIYIGNVLPIPKSGMMSAGLVTEHARSELVTLKDATGALKSYYETYCGNQRLYFNDDSSLRFEADDVSNYNAFFIVESGTGNDAGIGTDADGEAHGLWSQTLQDWILAYDGGKGNLTMPPLLYSAVTYAGNVYVNNNGVLSKGSSSSRRYKKDIVDIGGELDPAKLYDVRVVQFKYRDDYLGAEDQRYGKDVGGFIAEELEQIYPIAVDYADEQPEDWNYRYLVPPMLKLIQDQKAEIDELRERIEKLEGK